MANEFVARNGLISQNNSTVTGSLTVTNGITGSLFGTASWASNATSSSFAGNSLTASYLNTLNQNLTFNGNLTLNGTASISYLDVRFESASVIYSSGSNQFGDASNDTQTLYGTVSIPTGPLVITGSVFFTGSGGVAPAVYINNVLRVTRAAGGTGFIIEGETGKVTGGGSSVVYEPYNYSDASHNFNIGHATVGNFNWSVGTNSTLSSNTQLMRLTRGGSLGIRTTNPAATLDVSGSVNISGSGVQVPLQVSSGSTPLLFVSRSGTVGIGTSTPLFTLDIQSAATGSLRISGSGGSQITLVRPTAGLTGFLRYVGTAMELGTAGSDSLNLFTGNTARLAIDTSGNVGIGIGAATPSARLHVSGASSATLLEIDSPTVNNIILVSGSGDISIRKSAPTATLDISGSTLITGSLNVSSGITGSLFGTASYSNTSTSASYAQNTTSAQTASYVTPLNQTVIITGSLLLGTGSIITTNVYGFTPNLVVGMNTGSSGGVLDLRNTSMSIVAGNTLGTIQFSALGDSTAYPSSQIRSTVTGTPGSGNAGGGNISIWTGLNQPGASPAERMRVNSNGQVLIGLTSSLDTTTKLIVDGSTKITGSLNVSQGITGSLFGTASFAISASEAANAAAVTILTQDVAPVDYNITFVGGTSGTNVLQVDATTLTYKPSTTTLTVTNLAGTASFAISSSRTISASFASTASYVNPLNQKVIITGSLIQGAAGNISSGTGAHAEGFLVQALGTYSHAEGINTVAYNEYSHAEGSNTISSGSYSHAEGTSTIARGISSHAEGASTIAQGSYSHAEGSSTLALGPASHAEGLSTTAQGDYSHTEGQSTTATGTYSHAEGYLTQAIGSYSHTEGAINYARGNYSHAEGTSTSTGVVNAYKAGDDASISGGVVTINSTYGDITGNFGVGNLMLLDDSDYDANYNRDYFRIVSRSFDGTNTFVYLSDTSVATTAAIVGDPVYYVNWGGDEALRGDYSHTEGSTTSTIGSFSHAEGQDTLSSGIGAHAEGGSTVASGPYSHAEGQSTVASGQSSHAEGESTYAYGTTSHTEGFQTRTGVFGYNSTSIVSGVITLDASYGDVTSIISSDNYIILYDSEFDNIYTITVFRIASSTFTGGGQTEITLENNTVSTTKAFIGSPSSFAPSGADRLIPGLSAHAEGNDTRAVGDFSHAEGVQVQAIGRFSHAEGDNTVASGYASHAEGWNTQATNTYAHAEGRDTVASGSYAHAEGRDTAANGSYSHAEGESTQATNTAAHAEGGSTVASGPYSHAEGQSTVASGQSSHAEGSSTIASGLAAHAEGLGTKASGDYQHAQGLYNIEDVFAGAFIVGNGSSDGNRSNLIYAAGTNVQITGSLRGQVSALSIASNTASINLATNNFFTINLVNGANTHISASNIRPGQTINLRVSQSSAGTGTVSFNSAIEQASGAAYTGSMIANAEDIVTFISFDSTKLYMSAIRNLV